MQFFEFNKLKSNFRFKDMTKIQEKIIVMLEFQSYNTLDILSNFRHAIEIRTLAIIF